MPERIRPRYLRIVILIFNRTVQRTGLELGSGAEKSRCRSIFFAASATQKIPSAINNTTPASAK